MIDFSKVRNYYIACGYTDMRKQIDGLVAIVQLQFGRELDEESLFLFCGHRADRLKALYWDGTGYILLYIDAENNLILIKGAVPGPKKCLVTLKETVKAGK